MNYRKYSESVKLCDSFGWWLVKHFLIGWCSAVEICTRDHSASQIWPATLVMMID